MKRREGRELKCWQGERGQDSGRGSKGGEEGGRRDHGRKEETRRARERDRHRQRQSGKETELGRNRDRNGGTEQGGRGGWRMRTRGERLVTCTDLAKRGCNNLLSFLLVG